MLHNLVCCTALEIRLQTYQQADKETKRHIVSNYYSLLETTYSQHVMNMSNIFQSIAEMDCYGLSTPGNTVAENGNKLLPKL